MLYQCGSSKPDASAPGVAGLTSPRFFQVPLYKAAMLDTNAGAFMAELDVVDRVQLTSPYSSTPCLQKIGDTCGKVVTSVYNPNTYKSTLDDAQLAANDAIFLSDRDDTVMSASTDSRGVIFSSYNSPGALQRAEWIKAMAPFFNKEYEAQAIFERVRAAYNGLKRAVTGKRMLWIAHSAEYDDYYNPGTTIPGSITFSWAAFKADFSEVCLVEGWGFSSRLRLCSLRRTMYALALTAAPFSTLSAARRRADCGQHQRCAYLAGVLPRR